MLWQWLDAEKLENEKWVEMTDFSWMLLFFFHLNAPRRVSVWPRRMWVLKKNLKQLNIYETKFKSLRKNFTSDTSLFLLDFSLESPTPWRCNPHKSKISQDIFVILNITWNISDTCNFNDNLTFFTV